MKRNVPVLAVVLSLTASALSAEMPDAWKVLEKLCLEKPYETPLDAAAVLSASGWSEIGSDHLQQAAALYGSAWALEHPMLDPNAASAEEIMQVYTETRARFLSSVLASDLRAAYGVLVHSGAGFSAYARYRQSSATPRLNRFPCEVFVVGDAHFLDARFDAEEWKSFTTRDSETAHQVSQTALMSISRNFTPAAAVAEAGLQLPDYIVNIEGF